MNEQATEHRNDEQIRRAQSVQTRLPASREAMTESAPSKQSGDIVGNAPWPDTLRFVREQRSWDEVPPEQP
jgi:hypothetical protein